MQLFLFVLTCEQDLVKSSNVHVYLFHDEDAVLQLLSLQQRVEGVEQGHELFPAVAVGNDDGDGVPGGAVGRPPRAPGAQHTHASLHLGLRQQDGRGRHVDVPT